MPQHSRASTHLAYPPQDLVQQCTTSLGAFFGFAKNASVRSLLCAMYLLAKQAHIAKRKAS